LTPNKIKVAQETPLQSGAEGLVSQSHLGTTSSTCSIWPTVNKLC